MTMTDVLILTADEPLLAAPTSLILADHLALDRLRRDLGGRSWQLAEGGPELVLHEHLLERGLEPAIRAVLTGASQRLRLPSKAQLKLAAQGGDLAACYELGRRLGAGGRDWLARAAARGHLGAMEALGDAFWLERLVEAQPSPARLRAACFKLSIYAERAGDLAGAIAWLERGGPGAYASLRLGRLYDQAGDPRQAFVWLERAIARDELALPDYLEARRELERLGAKGVQP
jgi:tetratricopeptide (TPR) repeat protein